jgi:UDP-3-O-[3-hydroxymyristoyl] glucosamine N-acyltransferase
MEFTIRQISKMLNGQVKGDEDAKITMLAKIQDAKEGQVAFLANPKYEPYLFNAGNSCNCKEGFSAQEGDQIFADPC